ncbi:hypothetical protein ACFTSD_02800 [Nocardiaceae bacterium NPDC056970]
MSTLMAQGERAFDVRVGVAAGNGVMNLRAQKVMAGTGTGAVIAWQRLQSASGTLGRVTVPENAWTTLLSTTAVGTGLGTFQGVYAWGSDALQWISFTRSVRLLVNGTQVAYQTGSFTTNFWDVTLTTGERRFYEGDVVLMQAFTSGTGRVSARNVDSSRFSLTAT